MAPHWCCGLIPGACEYVTCAAKGTWQIYLRLRTMRWEHYSELSWWAQFNPMSPWRQKTSPLPMRWRTKHLRDATLMALKIEEKVITSKGKWAAPRSWKLLFGKIGNVLSISIGPPVWKQPCLILAHWDLAGCLTYRTVRWYIGCCKPPSSW